MFVRLAPVSNDISSLMEANLRGLFELNGSGFVNKVIRRLLAKNLGCLVLLPDHRKRPELLYIVSWAA